MRIISTKSLWIMSTHFMWTQVHLEMKLRPDTECHLKILFAFAATNCDEKVYLRFTINLEKDLTNNATL